MKNRIFLTCAVAWLGLVGTMGAQGKKPPKEYQWVPNYHVEVWIGGEWVGEGDVLAENRFHIIASDPNAGNFALSFVNPANGEMEHLGQFALGPDPSQTQAKFSYFFNTDDDGKLYQIHSPNGTWAGDWKGGTFTWTGEADLYVVHPAVPTGDKITDIVVVGTRISPINIITIK